MSGGDRLEGPLHKAFGVPDDSAGHALFPEMITSEDCDRRILHSEQRIKFWIVAGVASNLVVAITAAIPALFYVGQISASITQASQTMAKIEAAQEQNMDWVRNRMVWEARVEEALKDRERK